MFVLSIDNTQAMFIDHLFEWISGMLQGVV